MNERKAIDVKDRYSMELNEINYILKNLEKGRYYENSGAKMDGYLASNIIKIRKQLNDLINKIEYDMESDAEHVGKIFSKINDN